MMGMRLHHTMCPLPLPRLSEEIQELSEVVRRQKREIRKYSVYQKFMERVLEQSEEVCVYVFTVRVCDCVFVCQGHTPKTVVRTSTHQIQLKSYLGRCSKEEQH